MTEINTLEREVFDSAYSLLVNPSTNGTRDIAYKIAEHYQKHGNEEQRKTIKQYEGGNKKWQKNLMLIIIC